MLSKQMFKGIFLVLTLTCGSLLSDGYPLVDESTWNAHKPYFLPINLPIKKKLDEIFSKGNTSFDSLVAAGFKLTPVQGNRVRVFTHPGMPGFVFKILMDPDHANTLLNRVKGARIIHQAIESLGLQHLFSVPDKWIYPFYQREGESNFILVAKDMRPYSREANIELWMRLTNKKVLDGLYAILMETGASDSTKENNIPWCRDNKIAFVDTEQYHDWENIRFERLEKVLSPKMKAYWQALRIR